MSDKRDISPLTATGADLDKLAADLYLAPRRGIVNDGRRPHFMVGLPLETDEELRARVLRDIGE